MSSFVRERILEPCSLKGFNYQLDTYIGCEHLCCYCYALNKAETDWENEVLIHKNLEARLPGELSCLEPQVVYLGMNSDPYQQSEAVLYQTRTALQLLAAQDFSASVLTKSRLITRDISLFKTMHSSAVGISVAFTDESTRKHFEKNAPSTADRINALGKLKEAGIKTYTLICPVIPYITDLESLLERVAPCSDEIWVYKLEMNAVKDPNWLKLRPVLELDYPDLLSKIREIAFSPNHDHWQEIRECLQNMQSKFNYKIIIEV